MPSTCLRLRVTYCSNVRGSAPPIKRQLTDRVQLRWIQYDRAVDVSKANASARSLLRRQLQRLLGSVTDIACAAPSSDITAC